MGGGWGWEGRLGGPVQVVENCGLMEEGQCTSSSSAFPALSLGFTIWGEILRM